MLNLTGKVVMKQADIFVVGTESLGTECVKVGDTIRWGAVTYKIVRLEITVFRPGPPQLGDKIGIQEGRGAEGMKSRDIKLADGTVVTISSEEDGDGGYNTRMAINGQDVTGIIHAAVELHKADLPSKSEEAKP